MACGIVLFDLGTRKVEVFLKEPGMNTIFIGYDCGFVESLVSMDGFSLQFNDFYISWPSSGPFGISNRNICWSFFFLILVSHHQLLTVSELGSSSIGRMRPDPCCSRSAEQYKDVENGSGELEKPFIPQAKRVDSDDENETNASIRMALLSTCVAVCGSFEFGSCVGFSSPTQSAIREDLNLSLSQYSTFGSIITIGAMIGAITSGRIADFIGRKGAMRISAVFCISGWLAVYFAVEAWLLDIGRICTGYGIGIFSYVVPVFIAEIAPKNLRGGLATLNQLMIVIGSSTAYILGTVLTWRTLALTGLIPCFLLLVGLFFIPESPRWLAKVGLHKEFELSIRTLRGKDSDVSQEAAEIQASIDTLKDLTKVTMLDLFDAKYTRPLVIGVGLMFFQQFGGINGIGFYTSETFVAAGFSSAKIGTIMYATIQVPITVVGVILMDKSGRRPLLMVSATGTFIGCFLIGASFFLKGQALLLGSVPILAAFGVLFYISAFSIGLGAVPWVIMSEIFPIHVKGVAGSFVVLMNWLGAWAISYTFNFLMTWSPTGTFIIYVGFSVLTVVFVAKIVPETKGKTLLSTRKFMDMPYSLFLRLNIRP